MSETTQGIDTAALTLFLRRIKAAGGATAAERAHLADRVEPLIEQIDTLTAQLAAVERERDAARDVLGAAQYLIRAETRLRLQQIDAERVAARDGAWRGLCDAVARCDPDNSTALAAATREVRDGE